MVDSEIRKIAREINEQVSSTTFPVGFRDGDLENFFEAGGKTPLEVCPTISAGFSIAKINNAGTNHAHTGGFITKIGGFNPDYRLPLNTQQMNAVTHLAIGNEARYILSEMGEWAEGRVGRLPIDWGANEFITLLRNQLGSGDIRQRALSDYMKKISETPGLKELSQVQLGGFYSALNREEFYKAGKDREEVTEASREARNAKGIFTEQFLEENPDMFRKYFLAIKDIANSEAGLMQKIVGDESIQEKFPHYIPISEEELVIGDYIQGHLVCREFFQQYEGRVASLNKLDEGYKLGLTHAFSHDHNAPRDVSEFESNTREYAQSKLWKLVLPEK